MRTQKTPILDLSREDAEQCAVVEWANRQACKYPELKRLFHVPNGGRRGKIEGARFKAQGVRAGVPDLILPAPRGGYHGLYVEMKRQKGGTVEPEQLDWLAYLTEQGYRAGICRGADEAIRLIKDYLDGKEVRVP